MNNNLEELEKKFTKYEIARILGARALQIAMDAPLLVKVDKTELERIKYDPLMIAEKELRAEALPITVNRPLPRKTDREIATQEEREGKTEEKKDDKEEDKKIMIREQREEENIKEEGEIMELANPDDEEFDGGSDGDGDGGEME